MSSKKKKQNVMVADDIVLNEDTPFSVQEAYKALRTNIIFSLTGDGCKVIGVTSSARSEGKSSTSLNVAISFGQIGKRVLLIDGDLRLPTIASKLGVQGTPGLSDLLVSVANVGDCVHVHQEYGITVMPSGSIPPDATKLLASPQMRAIMPAIKKYFDYIIIDLPPVNTVTDAAILSDIIDGYVLLCRHNQSDMNAIGFMVEQLKRADANIIGFVYNDAPVAGKKSYGYSYGYYK